MPTCPGCQQRVPHERLPDHVEHCAAVFDDDARERRSIVRLERRVDRLERHVREHDLKLERTVEGGPDEEGDLPPLRR